MELPVLGNSSSDRSPDWMARLVKAARMELAQTYCRVTDLSTARLFTCPDRPMVHDANFAGHVTADTAESLAAVLPEIDTHFNNDGLMCHCLIPTRSDGWSDDRSDSLVSEHGYKRESLLIMAMQQAVRPESIREDVQILPARAAQAQYLAFQRDLHSHTYTQSIADGLAACAMDVLDDSRLDMFIARIGGRVAATAGVMTLNQCGIIRGVATHPEFRRQQIQTTLLSSVLDHCARAQLSTLVLETDPEDQAAIRLYESIGMVPVCTYDVYRRPSQDR